MLPDLSLFDLPLSRDVHVWIVRDGGCYESGNKGWGPFSAPADVHLYEPYCTLATRGSDLWGAPSFFVQRPLPCSVTRAGTGCVPFRIIEIQDPGSENFQGFKFQSFNTDAAEECEVSPGDDVSGEMEAWHRSPGMGSTGLIGSMHMNCPRREINVLDRHRVTIRP